MAVVVVVALIFTHGKLEKIDNEAKLRSKAEQEKSLQAFRENTKKLNNADECLKRGIKFLKNNESQKAVALLERTVDLNNTFRDPNFYLGYAYLKDLDMHNKDMSEDEKKSELTKAKKALLAAQRIDPLYPTTNKLLGIVAQSEHNDNEKRLWYARYDTVTGNVISVKLTGSK